MGVNKKMNTHKMLVVLIIGLFIVSSTGGFLGAGENLSNNTDGMISKIEEHKISISKPVFTYTNQYIAATKTILKQHNVQVKYER